MQWIKSLRDLEPFGIVPLTGEADNLTFRMLCDLTAQGAELVALTYGLLMPCDKRHVFPENWNSGSEKAPHVASVMLPYGAWKDIGILALLRGGCHTVLRLESGTLCGMRAGEHYRRAEYNYDAETGTATETVPAKYTLPHMDGEWLDWPASDDGHVARVFQFNPGHPSDGTGRNVHAMSGRTV